MLAVNNHGHAYASNTLVYGSSLLVDLGLVVLSRTANLPKLKIKHYMCIYNIIITLFLYILFAALQRCSGTRDRLSYDSSSPETMWPPKTKWSRHTTDICITHSTYQQYVHCTVYSCMYIQSYRYKIACLASLRVCYCKRKCSLHKPKGLPWLLCNPICCTRLFW